MKMMLIGGLLITFPALVVVVWFFGHDAMAPALASLALNSLPFLVAAWLLRDKGDDEGADAH